MAGTYDNTVKAARMTATRDELASGTLEIGSTGFATVLAVFDITALGGTISTDTWTLAFDSNSVTAVADGTAAEARLKDSVGDVKFSGLTVDTSAADIIIDNTNIASGQTVTTSGASIQHAA